jgi:hypothetical protein
MRRISWVKWVGALGLAFLLLQVVPVDRSNPSGGSPLAADPAVVEVLRRACYDCHSNETVWPWYSRVAPVSWLVSHDVVEGREVLNFSVWEAYAGGARREMLEEIWEEVAEGEMPLESYLLLHPEARLTQVDREVLESWVRRERKDVVTAGSSGGDDSHRRRRRGRDDD